MQLHSYRLSIIVDSVKNNRIWDTSLIVKVLLGLFPRRPSKLHKYIKLLRNSSK